jgi:uracil-DNA glycosylase family 4
VNAEIGQNISNASYIGHIMLNNVEIKHLLGFLVGSGIDYALDNQPVDRRQAARPAPLPQPEQSLDISAFSREAASSRTPKPAPQSYHISPAADALAAASANAAIAQARQLADAATTLAELEEAVRAFDGCALKKTARNTVFADGTPGSAFMLVGEAPGADEDAQGIPFCGVSGQLLDTMLSHIGLTRTKNFYITNTLFWRPPGNRTPSTEELEICLPFVEKHIALIQPKVLILVGGTAAKALLGETRGITRLRGQHFSYNNQYLKDNIHTQVIFHPSYLLRQPLQKKTAWHDLLNLREHARQQLGIQIEYDDGVTK